MNAQIITLTAVVLFLAGLVILIARDAKATRRRLNNLRRNCFVTNERGHRTRYANASPEVRAKAETP